MTGTVGGVVGMPAGGHLGATALNMSDKSLSDKTFTYSIAKGALVDVSWTGAPCVPLLGPARGGAGAWLADHSEAGACLLACELAPITPAPAHLRRAGVHYSPDADQNKSLYGEVSEGMPHTSCSTAAPGASSRVMCSACFTPSPLTRRRPS